MPLLNKEKLNKLSLELEELNLKKDLGDLADILYEFINEILKLEIKDGISGTNGSNGKNGLDGLNGKNGTDGLNGTNGLNGADGSPDVGKTIVAKLSSLDDEDKLPIEAIRDLEKRLDELKNQISRKSYVGGGGSGVMGGHVQYYDLSSQLNGSLRVFSMPAFARILNVQLSSFPNILRPVVDWTSNASASTLTLTSEIPDSSISSGQTLVVLYATL